MSIPAALIASVGRVMTELLLDAAEQAQARALISAADAERATRAINHSVDKQVLPS